MNTPTKHNSHSKARTRKAHLMIKPNQLGICINCQRKILPHRPCSACGFYRGKQVMMIKQKKDKKK